MMVATQESLVETLFKNIWNKKELDRIPDIFTENCVVHIGEKTWEGVEGIANALHHWHVGFPDIHHHVDQVLVSDDKVVAQWHGQGTHQGIFFGMLPTGKKVHYHGITIFKLCEGKFCEIWLAPDMDDLFKSLKTFSEKTYTDEDFCEDFSGPAGNIYAYWMNARPTPSPRQALANAMRELASTAPLEGEPALVVPDELMNDVEVQEHQIPTRDGHVRALVYLPKGYRTKNLPMMVYYHGGGWSVGKPESTDLITRKFAHLGEMVVVSVDYRLAPEFRYPHGLHDCVDAYKWARERGNQLFSANNERIVVAGDSAGGNLCAAVAIAARNSGYRLPEACLMLCPLTDFVCEKYPSTFKYGENGLCYDYPYLCAVRANYARYDQLTLPEVSPMYDDLKGLCPIFVLTAGRDPLYDENCVFVNKLKKAGGVVEHVVHDEMPHSYYYFLGLTKEEEDAYQKMCGFLRKFLLS